MEPIFLLKARVRDADNNRRTIFQVATGEEATERAALQINRSYRVVGSVDTLEVGDQKAALRLARELLEAVERGVQ